MLPRHLYLRYLYLRYLYLLSPLLPLLVVRPCTAQQRSVILSDTQLESVDEKPKHSSDTLTGQVASFGALQKGEGKLILGNTRDLALLSVRVVLLKPGRTSENGSPSEVDNLFIIKDGHLKITTGETSRILGPGGVALISDGEHYRLQTADNSACTYYILNFQSRSPKDLDRARKAGPVFFLDWPEMVMKKTDKGESRQIFDRPAAWLGRIDMHATTLNAGEVSHPPHIHRAEEIILMRSGNVQEYIGGKYYKATAGDLIFLPSGVPHAVENKSNERCEYFALQWML